MDGGDADYHVHIHNHYHYHHHIRLTGGEGVTLSLTNGTLLTGTVGAGGLQLLFGAVVLVSGGDAAGPWTGFGITVAYHTSLTVTDAGGSVIGFGSLTSGAGGGGVHVVHVHVPVHVPYMVPVPNPVPVPVPHIIQVPVPVPVPVHHHHVHYGPGFSFHGVGLIPCSERTDPQQPCIMDHGWGDTDNATAASTPLGGTTAASNGTAAASNGTASASNDTAAGLTHIAPGPIVHVHHGPPIIVNVPVPAVNPGLAGAPGAPGPPGSPGAPGAPGVPGTIAHVVHAYTHTGVGVHTHTHTHTDVGGHTHTYSHTHSVHVSGAAPVSHVHTLIHMGPSHAVLMKIHLMIKTEDMRVVMNRQWLSWIASNAAGLLQWTVHVLGGGKMDDFKRKLVEAVLETMGQLCLHADTAIFERFGVPIPPLPALCSVGPPPVPAAPCGTCTAGVAPCPTCGIPVGR